MENKILHNNQNSQHAIPNNCCSKRGDASSTLEVQSFDNPSDDSCVIINLNVNNDTTQNKVVNWKNIELMFAIYLSYKLS